MINGLLPEGLRDRLAPHADAAATLVNSIVATITARGYHRVQPPLIEFEDELVGRLKGASTRDLFRMVDPVSGRTLVLRPDITAQISRIATTQLALASRPLKLCYAGQVLKLRGTQLRPEREMTQIGAEMIGDGSTDAAIEVVLSAIAALANLGIHAVTLDLTMPNLVETLANGPMPLPPANIGKVCAALDAKDAGSLTALGGDAYLPLLAAPGALSSSLALLRQLDAAKVLEPRLIALEAIAEAVGDQARITLDPTERHGFEYQSWFGFSLFVQNIAGEVGRGGSYTIVHADATTGQREEPAMGFSIYPDLLAEAV